MRILAFSAYYAPEIAASLYVIEGILEAAVEGGNQVKLFVPAPTRGVSEKVRRKYKKRKREYHYNGRLEIHRISLFRENRKTLARALRYVILEVQFLIKGLRTKTDLIFVQSTPPIQGAMAAVLKKIKRVPFVYNLQDIFPDSMVNAGMTKKGSLIWKIGRRIEQFTYRNADKIVVNSKDFKRNIMEKGVPEEKIEIVYNWVDENAVVHVDRENNPLFDKYNLDRNKFYVCYSGNIGYSQNMDMLLNVAKEISAHDEIGFVIVGDGAEKERVEERIRRERIQNVTLIPFQPYKDISYVFSLGDVGLIISKAGIGSSSVPSKTWSIMSAGRPVLASFDKGSELDEIVTKNQCGICVEPDNADALRKAVIELASGRDRLPEMGKAGRAYIVKNLTGEIGKRNWKAVMAKYQSGKKN